MLPQQLQDELLIIKNEFKNYSQYSVIELEALKEECIKLQKKLYFYYEKTVALLTQSNSEYSTSPIFAQEIQYINDEVQKITISKKQVDGIINMINYRIKALNTNYTQQKEKEIFNFLQQLIAIENISAIKTYLQNTPINLNIDQSIFIMAMRVYRDEKSDVTLAILQILIDYGFNIKTVYKDQYTALHFAIEFNKVAIIQLLIENGININAQNINGETGLHLAVMENNIEIVELLINAGADIEIETNDEETALCIAIADKNVEMVWLLFKNNANVKFEAKSGWNFLHLAVQNNNIDITKLLIEQGVNINLQNRAGETPLHFAIWKGYIETVMLLIENGADIEIKDNQGYSPLYLAVYMNNIEIFQLLIDFGANINNEHSEHQAMLKIAQQNQNKKMVALLKSNASLACCNLL
ncbi:MULTISPECIES: ankyrin repeat domain-containing protein [unclassified Spiroplasma]|uniref:ankyrin repeat domain-containing protein n=1 Tax=unclassified Spiroplasma TaxID=2637901 RepID=UPI00313B34A7